MSPILKRRTPYVCGPLTELPPSVRPGAKALYEGVAQVCQEVLGVRAFVPHEHFDPINHPNFSPREVDATERTQVCERTSVLIVIPLAPSWGGGIEVEMAYRSGVPVILLGERTKLSAGRISRLLRGNPGITESIFFVNKADACRRLEVALMTLRPQLLTT